jgi:SAM-dependent methyltransferase
MRHAKKPLKYQLLDTGLKFDKKPHKLDILLRNQFKKRGSENDFYQIIDHIQSGRGHGELFLPKIYNIKEYTLLQSVDANRILKTYQFILDILKKYRPKKILELGCGAGLMASIIKKNLEIEKYLGIDQYKNLVDIATSCLASNKFDFTVGNYFDRLDIEEKNFDIIMADCAINISALDVERLPHNHRDIDGTSVCPNCIQSYRDCLKKTFFESLEPLSESDTKLILVNRITCTQDYIAFIKAAQDMSWSWDTMNSKIVEFYSSEKEMIGCLVFERCTDRCLKVTSSHDIVKWLGKHGFLSHINSL